MTQDPRSNQSEGRGGQDHHGVNLAASLAATRGACCWWISIRRATRPWAAASTSTSSTAAAATCCSARPVRVTPAGCRARPASAAARQRRPDCRRSRADATCPIARAAPRAPAASMSERIRLRPDRLSAVAEHADGQCAGRGARRDHSDPVRVLRARRPVGAARDRREDTRAHQSAPARWKDCCAPCTIRATASPPRSRSS